MPKLKVTLLENLMDTLEEKQTSLQENIDSITESRDIECKCSVGDKHETGRAMTQMELDKYQGQMAQLQNQIKDLKEVKAQKEFKKVEFGSIVKTNNANFFMAGALGKVKIENGDFYVISMVSPIGKAIMNKTTGEKIMFQGREIQILDIC